MTVPSLCRSRSALRGCDWYDMVKDKRALSWHKMFVLKLEIFNTVPPNVNDISGAMLHHCMLLLELLNVGTQGKREEGSEEGQIFTGQRGEDKSKGVRQVA